MKKMVGSLLGAFVAIGTSAPPEAARAATLSAASGTQSNGGIPHCFSYGDNASGFVGVSRVDGGSCNFAHWITPLLWQNFFSAATNRTIVVRGKRPTSSDSFTCTAFIVDTAGNFVSSQTKTLSATGGYTSMSLTVNQVLSGRTGFVSCFISGGSNLLALDYTP